jgi:hypothetical protein
MELDPQERRRTGHGPWPARSPRSRSQRLIRFSGCDSGLAWEHYPSIATGWKIEDWLRTFKEILCTLDDAQPFGPSGQWGLFATHDDSSILGGCGTFMDRFVAAEAGRCNVLAKEFITPFNERVGIDVKATENGWQLLALAGRCR